MKVSIIQKVINQVSEIPLMVIIPALILLTFINCQHARIRVSPPLPSECKPWDGKKDDPICQAKRAEQKKSLEEVPTTVKEYEQIYYYWGLRPNDIAVRLDEECPQGVLEIHQFSTFKNGLYEQVTLGFYSPRTLRLTCFTRNPFQDQPIRRR